MPEYPRKFEYSPRGKHIEDAGQRSVIHKSEGYTDLEGFTTFKLADIYLREISNKAVYDSSYGAGVCEILTQRDIDELMSYYQRIGYEMRQTILDEEFEKTRMLKKMHESFYQQVILPAFEKQSK